jgi:DNA-binding CsgD family transcriptional regulator
MASNFFSPGSISKRPTHSQSKTSRKVPIPFSDPTLEELKAEARRCHTPKQFRELLERLRVFVPYEKFACSWGDPSHTIRFVYNHSFPPEFLRWYLSTGALWKSPMFHEWLRTQKVLLWSDVAKRLKSQFAPEMVRHVKEAGLQYSLVGGSADHEHFVWLNAAMASEQAGHQYMKDFGLIVPSLVEASQRAYPRSLLTKREMAILERRAMGQITKQIAAAEGISERTVREHLQQIKQKLYTDDLVNAVVIAVKSGMLLRSGDQNNMSVGTERNDDRDSKVH